MCTRVHACDNYGGACVSKDCATATAAVRLKPCGAQCRRREKRPRWPDARPAPISGSSRESCWHQRPRRARRRHPWVQRCEGTRNGSKDPPRHKNMGGGIFGRSGGAGVPVLRSTSDSHWVSACRGRPLGCGRRSGATAASWPMMSDKYPQARLSGNVSKPAYQWRCKCIVCFFARSRKRGQHPIGGSAEPAVGPADCMGGPAEPKGGSSEPVGGPLAARPRRTDDPMGPWVAPPTPWRGFAGPTAALSTRWVAPPAPTLWAAPPTPCTGRAHRAPPPTPKASDPVPCMLVDLRLGELAFVLEGREGDILPEEPVDPVRLSVFRFDLHELEGPPLFARSSLCALQRIQDPLGVRRSHRRLRRPHGYACRPRTPRANWNSWI